MRLGILIWSARTISTGGIQMVRVQLAHTATHPRHLTQRQLIQGNSPKYIIKPYLCLWIESMRHVISCVYESWYMSHFSSWAELIDTCYISHELNWHMSHFSSWPNKKACSPSQIISLQLSTIGIRWTTMAEAQLHVPQYPCIFWPACNRVIHHRFSRGILCNYSSSRLIHSIPPSSETSVASSTDNDINDATLEPIQQWDYPQEESIECGLPVQAVATSPAVVEFCIIPAEHIALIFEKLQEKAVTQPLPELTNYIASTWLGNPLWPSLSWSVFGRVICTNNDVEGWHCRLNQKAKKEWRYRMVVKSAQYLGWLYIWKNISLSINQCLFKAGICS